MSTTMVYVVRHGRTALNAQGRFRGRQDPPLDEQGFVEAAAAARGLAVAGLVAVYSSPLLRALQTAEPIATAVGVPVTPLPGLVDLDHGAWEGRTPEEAAASHPEEFARFRDSPRDARVPGGEAMADVETRVTAALEEIAERHAGAMVAAISHEIPIRLVVARLAGPGGPSFWDVILPTGSITELRFERGALSLAPGAEMDRAP